MPISLIYLRKFSFRKIFTILDLEMEPLIGQVRTLIFRIYLFYLSLSFFFFFLFLSLLLAPSLSLSIYVSLSLSYSLSHIFREDQKRARLKSNKDDNLHIGWLLITFLI